MLLAALQRCATRGRYVWRWTEAKRTAAKLIALGRSQRTIARVTGANRRSIARWVLREEFRLEVYRHRLGRAIREGLFRQVADACREREDAANAVLGLVTELAPSCADTADFVRTTRAYRAAAERERSLDEAILE